jgi:hypothetical protein
MIDFLCFITSPKSSPRQRTSGENQSFMNQRLFLLRNLGLNPALQGTIKENGRVLGASQIIPVIGIPDDMPGLSRNAAEPRSI